MPLSLLPVSPLQFSFLLSTKYTFIVGKLPPQISEVLLIVRFESQYASYLTYKQQWTCPSPGATLHLFPRTRNILGFLPPTNSCSLSPFVAPSCFPSFFILKGANVHLGLIPLLQLYPDS